MGEWSNIPALVPQFCLHLAKHLRGIIQHCRYEKENDRFQQLRREILDEEKLHYSYMDRAKQDIVNSM